MEQYTEKQYDDDLTVVTDEYNDSFQTDTVDLFEFPSYDESPIARLKSLVLSIDWEITDDVLRQFNEELVDLKDIWADEKIYLVYVQALEKISKYIYQEKADSNPNAIKLLLTFFYNLEKIISSDEMSEDEKKHILLEDVRKFEKLKQQIGRAARIEKKASVAGVRAEDTGIAPEGFDSAAAKNILFDLKAIVLGIDWEITEKELGNLRDEVLKLEEVFAESRPKMIFLQGIGTLGAYIRLKKNNAHADAFKLLHSFFAGLEKIVTSQLSFEEEKAILFPEVEKFNVFKTIIGSTVSAESLPEQKDEAVIDYEEDEYDEEEESSIAPAFSDMPEGETRGFQEDEEAAALGISSTLNVTSQVNMFFSEDTDIGLIPVEAAKTPTQIDREPRDEFRDAADAHLDAIFQIDLADEERPVVPQVDQETALRGVDVETEADDDSGELALPLEAGQLAPALAEIGQEGRDGIKVSGIFDEEKELAGDLENRLDDFFADEQGPIEEETPSLSLKEEDVEYFGKASSTVIAAESPDETVEALQGVLVETEADDDSEEEALAFADGDLAPALSDESFVDSTWDIETTSRERDELFSTPEEPIAAVSGNLQEENRLAELPGADAESEVALEDHLESFFALEEEAEGAALEVREQTVEPEIPAGEPFAEPSGERETQEIEIVEDLEIEVAGMLEEEQPLVEVEALEQVSPATLEMGAEEAVLEVPGQAIEQEEMPASELFAEPFGEREVEEIEIAEDLEVEVAGMLGEEQPLMEVEDLEPEPVFIVEEETAPIVAQEAAVLEEAAAETETISLPPAPDQEEPEEVVFELVEDELVQHDEDIASGAGEEAETLFAVEPRDGETADAERDIDQSFEPELSLEVQEAIPSLDTDEEFLSAVLPPESELVGLGTVSGLTSQDEEAEVETFLAEPPLREEDVESLMILTKGDEEIAEEVAQPPQMVEAEQLSTLPAGIDFEIPTEAEQSDLVSDERETPEDEGGVFAEAPLLPAAGDPLSNLRACVSSIGIELSDSIIQGLFKEINGLRSRTLSRPLEKLFLLLLSTITQHIDQYRYESSSESFSLLQSVTDGLAGCLSAASDMAFQEILLGETTKVLLWQQKMLSRQAVAKGGGLTFADPVRSESGQFFGDEKIEVVEGGAEEGIGFGQGQEMASGPDESQSAGEVTSSADALLFSDLEAELAAEHLECADTATPVAIDQLRSLIQGEFAQIRQEWQNDFAALRNELQGKDEQGRD